MIVRLSARARSPIRWTVLGLSALSIVGPYWALDSPAGASAERCDGDGWGCRKRDAQVVPLSAPLCCATHRPRFPPPFDLIARVIVHRMTWCAACPNAATAGMLREYMGVPLHLDGNSSAATNQSVIDFGADYGFLYTTYSIPNMVMPLFGGVLLDFFGIRRVMVVLSVISTAGHFFFAFGAAAKVRPMQERCVCMDCTLCDPR